MAKIVLNDVGDLTSFTTAAAVINANSAAIEVAMENTLSRDGTQPNTMSADLDMNGNRILNLPAPASVGEPARLVDVVTNPTITVPPVGTSGAVVGLLNANKTDSGTNTFSGVNTFTQVPVFPSTTFWNNTRLAKTANYTLANADKFKTISLGGNAYYTLTIPVASGFDANFAVTITNEDSTVSGGFHTGRGKTIAINGYPNFILWPGQTFTLMSENNAWRFNYPGRWRVQGLPIIFVNHASGNDSNDGLATGSGAFATIQAAIFVYEHFVDCNGFGPTIQVADETFTENNVTHTHSIIGYHGLLVTGNTTTPANCVWQVSGVGNGAIQARDQGNLIVTGFTFVSTGSGNFFLNAGQAGLVDFGSVIFGANPGGSDLWQSIGGGMGYGGGTVSITGDCAVFILGTGEGHLTFDGATVSIPNARAFSSAFVQIGPASTVSMTSMTFTGAGAGAGSTGAKYFVSNCATLAITSTTLPGATAGTVFQGGIVVPLLASKTNDLAQAGDVGEYLEGIGSAVALVTSTGKTVSSVTLTSGDWDVSALLFVSPAATTNISRYACGISSVTNTLDATVGKLTDTSQAPFVPGTVNLSQSLPPYRVSVASGATATIFLVGFATFTVSTCTASGIIRARRTR